MHSKYLTFLLLGLCLALLNGAAQAESLRTALAYTYLHNPLLEAARANESATQSDVRAAKSGWYPKLSLIGGLSRDNTSGIITLFPQSSNFSAILNQSRLAVRVEQPLYAGGSLSARVSAAENTASALHASTRALESRILLQTVSAYLGVVEAEATLKVQADNIRVLERHLKAAQDSLRHGEGTRTDVAQARARLEGAIAARIAAASGLARARADYRAIVGQYPGPLKLPAGIPTLPTSLRQAETLATENYPVVAARFQALAAANQANAVNGTLRPSIGLYAEVNRENDPQYGFSIVENRVVGIQISVPIWEGGAHWAQTAAARHRARAARLEVKNARRTAVNQAVSAWQNYTGTRATVTAFQAQVEAARIAYQGVEQAHRHGERTLLEALNAEQELRNARLALIRARATRIRAGYALLAASGRLSAQTLNFPSAGADLPNQP